MGKGAKSTAAGHTALSKHRTYMGLPGLMVPFHTDSLGESHKPFQNRNTWHLANTSKYVAKTFKKNSEKHLVRYRKKQSSSKKLQFQRRSLWGLNHTWRLLLTQFVTGGTGAILGAPSAWYLWKHAVPETAVDTFILKWMAYLLKLLCWPLGAPGCQGVTLEARLDGLRDWVISAALRDVPEIAPGEFCVKHSFYGWAKLACLFIMLCHVYCHQCCLFNKYPLFQTTTTTYSRSTELYITDMSSLFDGGLKMAMPKPQSSPLTGVASHKKHGLRRLLTGVE